MRRPLFVASRREFSSLNSHSLSPSSCRTRLFNDRSSSPLPRASGGEGAGVRGNPRGGGNPARSCVCYSAYRRWHRAAENVSSAGQPPHPQPFSPGKPGGEGSRKDSISMSEAEERKEINRDRSCVDRMAALPLRAERI